MEYKISVFKTFEESNLTAQYLEGQNRSLCEFGVTGVVCSKKNWAAHPDITLFCILDGENNVLGGLKTIELHPSSTESQFLNLSTSSEAYRSKLKREEILDMSGLWVSKKLRGQGMSATLINTVVSRARTSGCSEIVTLVSPHMFALCLDLGFTVASELGVNGTIEYPSKDIVSYFMRYTITTDAKSKANTTEVLLETRS